MLSIPASAVDNMGVRFIQVETFGTDLCLLNAFRSLL